MKGQILDVGLIVASDEKRYSFDVADVANLKDDDIKDYIGAEVDFEPNGGGRSIFI